MAHTRLPSTKGGSRVGHAGMGWRVRVKNSGGSHLTPLNEGW